MRVTMGRKKGVERRPVSYKLPVPLLESLEQRAEEGSRPVTTELELAIRAHVAGGAGAPVVGVVAAGVPIAPGEGHDRLVFHELFKWDDLAAFRVRGDSMRDQCINDGDYAIIRRQAEPADGKVVLVSINGEVTLKVYKTQRGVVYLHSQNSAKPPIKLTADADTILIGVLVGVVRKC